MNRRKFLQAIGLVAAAPAVAAKALAKPVDQKINPEWVKAGSVPHWDSTPSFKFDPKTYQGEMNWCVFNGPILMQHKKQIRFDS
jgi:hypothetical protein